MNTETKTLTTDECLKWLNRRVADVILGQTLCGWHASCRAYFDDQWRPVHVEDKTHLRALRKLVKVLREKI